MRAWFIAVSLALVALPAGAATGVDDLDRLTNDVLGKEIDFERHYLQWREVASKEPKWRRARYFGLQQAGSTCAMIAALFSVQQLGKHLNTPDETLVHPLKRGYTYGVVGGALGGGSSAFELGANTNVALKNRMKHCDPETERKATFARLHAIDALLKERDGLVAALPGEDSRAREAAAEGHVLKLFRDWCLYEYSTVYADIKSYQASNSFYYVLDIAAQSMSSMEYAMSTASLKRPTIAGSISTAGMVSDVLFMIGAPASTFAYNRMYNFWLRRLQHQAGEKFKDPEGETKVAMDELALAATTDGARARMEIYKRWAVRYDDYAEKSEIQLRHLSKVALQDNISGPLISANYLAGEIMGSVAFYKNQNRPKTSTKLYYAGAVASATASATSVGLTTQSLIREKLFERKLKKLHATPEELLARRLRTLDELDDSLASK